MAIKRKIMVSLTEDDIKLLDKISNGYSRSTTISLAITALVRQNIEVENLERKLFPPVMVGNDI